MNRLERLALMSMFPKVVRPEWWVEPAGPPTRSRRVSAPVSGSAGPDPETILPPAVPSGPSAPITTVGGKIRV